MSDPPLPLSPYAPSPASPSPQAANPRNFWRDIVRPASRPTPPSPSHPSHPPQIDAVRRHPHDPVNFSAFDDLPPAQVYDPAWNTNPLRCEAGRLGPQPTANNTPVLPSPFTIKSSDLEDEDDDDLDHDHSQYTTSPASTHPSPQPRLEPAPSDTLPLLAPRPSHPRETDRTTRPRRSISWRVQNPVAAVVKSKPTATNPTVFQSLTSFKPTCEALKHVLQHRMKGEIVSTKACDIRARVPIRSKHDTVATHIVVVSVDDSQNACQVSIRRSFADSFRISTHDFLRFCIQLQDGFRELQQFATR